ncbi:hypothetical protein CEXT_250741 [Caerostris extrusa]|uniref:Uncharacterized protein n=1 Tax=Caerostris extrusa TaxID=172846 RepID=A0AAV4PRS1_CAEEX|nr:hypothetical protein CEXT_250741 [Caerostris extrusa]
MQFQTEPISIVATPSHSSSTHRNNFDPVPLSTPSNRHSRVLEKTAVERRFSSGLSLPDHSVIEASLFIVA